MRKSRNSNFELLRIIAMLLITFCHFVAWKYITSSVVPVRWIANFLSDFGGLGDCLFFGITSWYMCASKPTFKKSVRRIWQFEKQLWFYAIGSFCILFVLQYVCAKYTFFASKGELLKQGVNSVIPVISGLWWYPTAYVLFVLLHPFINKCLQAAGERAHRNLVLVSFAIWGIVPFFPINMDLNVSLFIYQYILLAYVRWYHNDLLKSQKLRKKLLALGLCAGVGFDSLVSIIGALIGWNHTYTYMNQAWSFPSLFTALGLLMWAYQREERHLVVVNKIASATLAPFVLSMYPQTAHALKAIFDALTDNMSFWQGIVLNIGWVILIFAIGIIIDFIRQFIFKITVDRNKCSFFERIWDYAQHKSVPSLYVFCLKFIRS